MQELVDRLNWTSKKNKRMLYFMLGIMELELNLNVLLRFLMDVQEQLIMKAAREWVLD